MYKEEGLLRYSLTFGFEWSQIVAVSRSIARSSAGSTAWVGQRLDTEYDTICISISSPS